MELLCENTQRPQHVDYFRKKGKRCLVDVWLDSKFIPEVNEGAVNVGCGWNGSAWDF